MSIPSSGSSTPRSASTTSSRVTMETGYLEARQPHLFAALAREEVDALDEPHPVAAGAHDERMRPRAVGQEAHAAQEVAVRDARRDHEHVAAREVLGVEDARHVLDAVLVRAADL